MFEQLFDSFLRQFLQTAYLKTGHVVNGVLVWVLLGLLDCEDVADGAEGGERGLDGDGFGVESGRVDGRRVARPRLGRVQDLQPHFRVRRHGLRRLH